MAKKAKKPAAKKTAKKAKRRVSDKTLEAILIECALAVGQGVATPATISDDARKLWHRRFRRTIKRALGDGESWKKGRVVVLPLSTQMGRRAAQLAANGVISKVHATQAADEISNDPACPPGRGKFCS
jgi:hypothetical protein